MSKRFRFSLPSLIPALTLSLLGITTAAHAAGPQAIVFDAITGATLQAPNVSNPGYELIGDKVNLGNTDNVLGQPQLTGIDLIFAQLSGTDQQFDALNVNLRFYNNGQTGADPVFTDPATGILTFNALSAITSQNSGIVNDTLLTGHAYAFHIDFATPVTLSNGFNIGLAINYQGDTGSGLQSANGWTSALRSGNPLAIGSSDFLAPKYGYLRNFTNPFPSNPTADDFNFTQNDGRDLGTSNPNAGVAFRLYAAVVPETSSAGLLLAGAGLPLLGLAIRRRKAA